VFYIRIALVILWFIFASLISLAYAIPRWGNVSIDRDLARIFSWGTLKILGIQIEVEGREHLESHQPCIYVANHQSNLDISIFGSIYPDKTVIIGKKELKWIPFFGLAFLAAGNIVIDRQKKMKALAGLSRAVDEIRKKGVSIWVFPEGTRNRSKNLLLPFKKGPFHMAMQAQVPIVPLVAARLVDRINWKERKILSGKLKIRVLPPILPTESSAEILEAFSENVRNQMLEALRGLAF